MKVHVYGNQLNNAYNMTQFLRSSGVDAEMFLDQTSSSQQDYPWWEDTHLSPSSLPSWIHYFPTKPFFAAPSKLTRQMIREFSRCDVALVTGLGPILSHLAGVPFVFYSTGSDLNVIDWKAEAKSIAHTRTPLRSKVMRTLSMLTHNRMQAAAIRDHAAMILVLMGYQVNPVINKFGLGHKTEKCLLAWDTEKYRAAEVNEALQKKYGDYDLLFFMIARHSWKSIWGDWKGNDKFIRAYARFMKTHRANARLVMIDKGIDLESSRALVRELGIEDSVEWVAEMNKDRIRAFESLPNCVVVDQFWHDEWYRRYPEDRQRPYIAFGSGSLEAMSAGRPLITIFKDEAFYDGNFPPILMAMTEPEIEERLVQVWKMTPDERTAMGEAGRAFVYKWHDWRNATPRYVDALRRVFARSSP